MLPTDIWLFIINLLIWPALAFGIFTKRLNQQTFALSLGFLVVLDFAWLLYSNRFNHEVAELNAILTGIKEEQAELNRIKENMQPLVSLQVKLSAQAMAQINGQTPLSELEARLKMSKELADVLEDLNWEASRITELVDPVLNSIQQALFEKFSDTMLQEIGRRNFSEFVSKRPREQWTDALFFEEAKKYLKEQGLMSESLKLAIQRLEIFQQNRIL